MTLGISNIAWPVYLDDEVSRLLARQRIDSVDLAPARYFDLSMRPEQSEVRKVREFWESRGFRITGMQSLLFGSSLNLFKSEVDREEMLSWLDRVCFIGRHLGVEWLVFGSPKNRDRAGLSDVASQRVATEFFLRLGDVAERNRVTICLEPNPVEYGSNFLISTTEAANFVRLLGHPAIRMQLDTGALALCGEQEVDWLEEGEGLIGHVHLSAPGLQPLHQSDPDTLEKIEWALGFPGDFVPTIEMLTSAPELALAEIQLTLDFLYEVTSLKERGMQP